MRPRPSLMENVTLLSVPLSSRESRASAAGPASFAPRARSLAAPCARARAASREGPASLAGHGAGKAAPRRARRPRRRRRRTRSPRGLRGPGSPRSPRPPAPAPAPDPPAASDGRRTGGPARTWSLPPQSLRPVQCSIAVNRVPLRPQSRPVRTREELEKHAHLGAAELKS